MAEPQRQPTETIAKGARLLIVEARFYESIATQLLAGALRAIDAAEARVDVITVPGALEIPIAMAMALDAAAAQQRPYDGAVALGCVIRGETYHFEIVAGESARALMALAVARKLPLGNGILTVENEPQAMVRADIAGADKGGDAARAALTLVHLKRRLGLF
jgi:6,7-dimethyl-8-ribityllumazine synthase